MTKLETLLAKFEEERDAMDKPNFPAFVRDYNPLEIKVLLNHAVAMKKQANTLAQLVEGYEKSLCLAAGYVSTYPDWADRHPDEALSFLRKASHFDDLVDRLSKESEGG